MAASAKKIPFIWIGRSVFWNGSIYAASVAVPHHWVLAHSQTLEHKAGVRGYHRFKILLNPPWVNVGLFIPCYVNRFYRFGGHLPRCSCWSDTIVKCITRSIKPVAGVFHGQFRLWKCSTKCNELFTENFPATIILCRLRAAAFCIQEHLHSEKDKYCSRHP